MRRKFLFTITQVTIIVLVTMLVSAVTVLAATGTTDSPASPGSTNSYTLEDIWQRLDNGATGAQSAFTEPSVAPGTGTMHDLNDIMSITPALDASGATAADVLSTKTFWGLTGGEWGPQTGKLYGGCNCESGTLNGTRWCDNGDGTVTDLLGNSGAGQCLVWLKNANCTDTLATIAGGQMTWDNAVYWSSAVINGSCSLTDGSWYGAWWLPTSDQLKNLTHGTEPVLSGTPGAFTGVQSDHYWTNLSSPIAPAIMGVYVDLSDGSSGGTLKTGNFYVWPVRDGK